MCVLNIECCDGKIHPSLDIEVIEMIIQYPTLLYRVTYVHVCSSYIWSCLVNVIVPCLLLYA